MTTLGEGFDLQYNLSYLARLQEIGTLIRENEDIESYRLPIHHIKDVGGAECIVIGILFLCSGLKPSILDSQTKEKERVQRRTYISSDAKYYIEDESGRLELRFEEGFSELRAFMTGMVLGFVGKKDESNVFVVRSIVFPKAERRVRKTERGKLLVFSNTELDLSTMSRLRMTTDALKGEITAVVLLGRVFGALDTNLLKMFQRWTEGLEVPLYVIPSEKDPTTRSLPQSPMPEFFFAKGKSNRSEAKVHLLTNPSQLELNGLSVAFLSRHLLEEMAKYVVPQSDASVQVEGGDYRNHIDESALRSYSPANKADSRHFLQILEQLAKLRHLVPCAPDTLELVPYSGKDPFVTGFLDLIVAGGCDSFMESKISETRLLCSPDYKKTGLAVLYDVENERFLRVEAFL